MEMWERGNGFKTYSDQLLRDKYDASNSEYELLDNELINDATRVKLDDMRDRIRVMENELHRRNNVEAEASFFDNDDGKTVTIEGLVEA